MFGLSRREKQQAQREGRIFAVYSQLAVSEHGEFEREYNAIHSQEGRAQARNEYEIRLRHIAYNEALRIVAQFERGELMAKAQGDFKTFENR